jgi:hypothetical protein
MIQSCLRHDIRETCVCFLDYLLFLVVHLLLKSVPPAMFSAFLTQICFRFCRPTLKSLSLGCCLRARDPALRQVAQLTSLQELSFAFCPFLSDASVGEIIARCRSLRRLVLVADVSLTMETIRARIRSNSKVRLEVGHCRGIKEESALRDADGECVYVQCTRLKFL